MAGDADLTAEQPLSGFAARIAYAKEKAARDAIADWAASGAMWLTGHSDRPPQLVGGNHATAVRLDLLGMQATAAAVGHDGSRLPDHRILGERAAMTGMSRNGRTSCGGATRLLDAADGTVAIALARPSDFESVPALIESSSDGDPWESVTAWCAETSVADILERTTLLGIAAAILPTDPPEPTWPKATALVGPRLVARPLTVVDLSALWAGPLCAHLLHLLGAKVISVESPRRPDPTRTSQPAFYQLLHAGIEQRQIDFATAEGRDQLLRLLANADIVIESSRPRALQQLGFDAEQLASDLGLVWVSITAYGRDDPRIGFGDDVAVAAGLAGAGPVFAGDAIADPMTGVVAADTAYLRALRGQTGVIDVPMHKVVMRSVGSMPDAEVVRRGDDWYVDTGTELIPVARPSARLVQ